MSYRSDMEFYKRDMQKRRKLLFQVIKITALALAAAILCTAILLTFDAFGGGFGGGNGREEEEISLLKFAAGKSVTVYAGDPIRYKSYVTYPDGYELSYEPIEDATVPGKYTVTYTLKKDGKTVDTLKLTLTVQERNVAMDELMALVEARAQELGITKEMTKVEQVRRIYDFVNSPSKSKNEANIYFNDKSNTGDDRSDWNTEKKWVEEATLTLKYMKGDCYSYFAVSKAFFTYFDIENVDIQRAPGSGAAGTHFWSMVNVGSKNEPRWYYYDSTRLGGTFGDGSRNACLITLEKLQSYESSDGSSGFYYFTPSSYPTASKEALN